MCDILTFRMTLQEAQQKYFNKVCDVGWQPLDRPVRANEAIPMDTVGVVVNEVYENCHGELLFKCDKLFTPFSVKRLKNPR